MRGSYDLHAPHLLDIEVAQVMRRLTLAEELAPARAERALEDFVDLPIERHGHTAFLPRIWKLRTSVTAYDAAYIALAEGLAAPLLTCDSKLSRAYGHGARIELMV